MPEIESFDAIFNKEVCVTVLGELSAWTSVQDIQAASRMQEGRLAPGDQAVSKLYLPFENGPYFTPVFQKLLEWFIAGYRVPVAKIAMACTVDPLIQEDTANFLTALSFRPCITLAHPGYVSALPRDMAAYIVEDQVAAIEVVQNPLRCLQGIVHSAHAAALDLYRLREKQKKTSGGSPTIFHHPYADSRLVGLIEALSFYTLGLDLGPRWAESGRSDFDFSYRSVNLCGLPPFNLELLETADQLMRRVLDGLH